MSGIIDKEEEELLESFENGEWQPIKDMEKELKKHREYAKNTFLKTSELIFVFPRKIWILYKEKHWKKEYHIKR